MKESFKKLNEYWKYEKFDKVFFIVFKALLLIFVGALLKQLLSSEKIEINVLLGFLGTLILWIILEVRMVLKEKSFPITILNHLTAEKDLEDINKKYSRKESIDEYISNSISQLNNNTCPIQIAEPQENQLCHQNVNDSLYYVLDDLIERTQNFLNTDLTKFSVGIYIGNIYDPSAKKGEIHKKPISVLFRDDFGVNEDFPQQVEALVQGNASLFYFQSKIQEVLKLNTYVTEHKEINSNKYLFVFAPIPNVCSDCPPDGVMILISRQKNEAPEDLENIMMIFGQIVSNWVSKFNDCVFKEKEHKELPVQTVENNVKKLTEPSKE